MIKSSAFSLLNSVYSIVVERRRGLVETDVFELKYWHNKNARVVIYFHLGAGRSPIETSSTNEIHSTRAHMSQCMR